MDTVERIEIKVEVGKQYLFNYPSEFVSLPDYSDHRGQVVTVLRELVSNDFEGDSGEYDLFWDEDESVPLDYMYEIQAVDGWTGHAWASELGAT